jgi:hypothetical protein
VVGIKLGEAAHHSACGGGSGGFDSDALDKEDLKRLRCRSPCSSCRRRGGGGGYNLTATKERRATERPRLAPWRSTTRNPLIHDEIHMTFSDFVIDHTTSVTNNQISS